MRNIIDFFEEHLVGTLVAIGCAIVIGITMFFTIPVKGFMKIEKYHWQWTIQLFEYQAVSESTWGSTESRWRGGVGSQDQINVVPENAYDITAEYKHYRNKEVVDRVWYDNDGNKHEETHTERIYKWHYTYKLNKWMSIYTLDSYGIDKNPYKPACDYPTYIHSPKIGDIIREGGHSEKYMVSGTVDDNYVTYEITKDVFDRLNPHDELYYKKYRTSNKIFDVNIAQ